MRQMTVGGQTAGRKERAKRHGGEGVGVEAADAPLLEALRAWRREREATRAALRHLSRYCRPSPASGLPPQLTYRSQRRRPEQAQALWCRCAEGGRELRPRSRSTPPRPLAGPWVGMLGMSQTFERDLSTAGLSPPNWGWTSCLPVGISTAAFMASLQTSLAAPVAILARPLFARDRCCVACAYKTALAIGLIPYRRGLGH
jgi:hypothetical protein